MSINSFGILGSVATTQLTQTSGSDAQNAAAQTANNQRQVAAAEQAESAAGVGQTDGENHETSERDADGRRLWERAPGKRAATKAADSPANSASEPPLSKDASGLAGNTLDLSG